jgi:hypothetical protein
MRASLHERHDNIFLLDHSGLQDAVHMCSGRPAEPATVDGNVIGKTLSVATIGQYDEISTDSSMRTISVVAIPAGRRTIAILVVTIAHRPSIVALGASMRYPQRKNNEQPYSCHTTRNSTELPSSNKDTRKNRRCCTRSGRQRTSTRLSTTLPNDLTDQFRSITESAETNS